MLDPAADGWRIFAGRGSIRLAGCWAEGMDFIPENPDMLWLCPPDADAAQQLTGLEIGDYRLSFDHSRATVHHHGSHDDPLFQVDHAAGACYEINLYRPVLAQQDRALLSFADGSLAEIPIQAAPGPTAPAPVLETRLMGWPDGPRRLEITAPDGAELIWQIARFGQFSEERTLLEAGAHTIDIPDFFADWIGIVVSTRNLHGPVEHKYMASGNLGAASARWILDGQTGRLYAPPQARHFAFRSVCVMLEHPPAHDDLYARVKTGIENAHELLFCLHLSLKGWMPDADLVAGRPFRIVSWGDLGDPAIAAADWVRLPPDCRADSPALARLRPDQKRSYGLFCDAAADDFPHRLTAAIAAWPVIRAHPAQWLDFAWLSAHHDPGGTNLADGARYGLGFSFPRSDTWYGKGACQKMQTLEIRRFLQQTSPCSTCPALIVAACRQILSRPGPLWWPTEHRCIGQRIAL